MASELSGGKTLVILAIVIGCFAILWPRIFYPMFQSDVTPLHEPIMHEQPPVIRERDPSGLYPQHTHILISSISKCSY